MLAVAVKHRRERVPRLVGGPSAGARPAAVGDRLYAPRTRRSRDPPSGSVPAKATPGGLVARGHRAGSPLAGHPSGRAVSPSADLFVVESAGIGGLWAQRDRLWGVRTLRHAAQAEVAETVQDSGGRRGDQRARGPVRRRHVRTRAGSARAVGRRSRTDTTRAHARVRLLVGTLFVGPGGRFSIRGRRAVAPARRALSRGALGRGPDGDPFVLRAGRPGPAGRRSAGNVACNPSDPSSRSTARAGAVGCVAAATARLVRRLAPTAVLPLGHAVTAAMKISP
jgi:hypothetical protein